MPYRVTKTYGHERGLSCAFRQHKAKSHCNLLHGYALSFSFVFEADQLDERNWVVDFGGLDGLKLALEYYFDHTVVVADNDPDLDMFIKLEERGLIRLNRLDSVGCEAFAEFAYNLAKNHLRTIGKTHVRVTSCTVAEHGSNSATYLPGAG